MTVLATPTAGRPTGSPVPAPAAPTGHFRVDIEGLRAVAVGLVVLDHVVGWPSGGFIGVDVFFVISGFLITGLLVRERQRTGRISFRAFYVRRARRLLPAAVATLVVTLLVSKLLFGGGRFRETLGDGIWALLFGANVDFARQGTDYFQQTAAPSPFQHFWSLAVEEQFYLVWPALILAVFALPLVRRAGRRGVLAAVMTLVVAGSLLWSVHATATSPATAYFSTFTRGWELAVGAVVAVAAGRLDRVPDRVRALLAWAGLAGIVLSAFVLDPQTPFPGTAAALPVLSAALLIAFGSAPGGPGVRWALGSALARGLGRISYSLYLWHWPVLVLLSSVLDPSSVTLQVTAVLSSVAVAVVSYHVVEQPVLHSSWLLPRRGRRAGDQAVFQRARTVGLVAALTACVAFVGVVLVAPPRGQLSPALIASVNAAIAAQYPVGGQPAAAAPSAPADPLTQEIQKSVFATSWGDLTPSLDDLPGYLPKQWHAGCFDVDAAEAEQCTTGDAGATHRAVVLGDSIAGAWLPGIQAGLQSRGWSVQTLGMGQCPNITAMTMQDNQPFTACAEHRDWALGYVQQTHPDLVVLSNVYNAVLADGDADRPTVWRDGLTSVIEQVQRSGARVVVLSSPPGGANLQTCATSLSSPTDCVRPPTETWQQYAGLEEQVAAATKAGYVDPEDWFCVQGQCPAVVGRTPVYADGVHMTAEYSTKIADEVADALLATS